MASKIVLKNNLDSEFTIQHSDNAGAKTIASKDMAQAVDTINDFPTNPHTGQVVIVRDLNRGGTFIYDATKVGESNDGTNFSGWVRQYSGAVNVKWFGAKYTIGVNDSPAIQLAIDSINAIEDRHSRSIFFPAGICYVETPILINQKDGLKIYGEGQQSSKIQAVGSMTPVLNTEFIELNGSGITPYTYDNIPAIFIIASTRRTGGSAGDDKDIPQTSNSGAAWYTSFEGLTLYGHNSSTDFNTGMTISGIYAPQFAQAQIKDMGFQYFLYGIIVNNIYRVTFNNVNFQNSHYGLNHTILNGVPNAGTSLSIINCGLSRVKYGWVFREIAYMSLVNATVDNWAYLQTTTNKEFYAYSFDSCRGATLSGCGCENASTLLNYGVFCATGPVCNLTVDGFFTINFNLSSGGAPNYLYIITNGARVNFNNCTFDYGRDPVSGVKITTSATVSFSNIQNRSDSLAIFNAIVGDSSSNIVFNEKEPYCVFNTGLTDISLAANTAVEPSFSDVLDTNCSSWVTSAGFTNKNYKSRFLVTFSGYIKGGGVDYILLNDGSADIKRALVQVDSTLTGEIPFSISHETTLSGIYRIRPLIRTTTTGTPVLGAGSNMIVRRIG